MIPKDPQHSVGVNKGAVKEFALYGPQDKIEALYAQTYPVFCKLGLKLAKAFRSQRRFEGGRPSVHDIIPWLQSLSAETPEADLVYFRQLHTTLRGRVHADVLAKIEA